MEWSEDGHGGAVESTPLDLRMYLLARVCTVLGCSTVLQHNLVLHSRVVCG